MCFECPLTDILSAAVALPSLDPSTTNPNRKQEGKTKTKQGKESHKNECCMKKLITQFRYRYDYSYSYS